MRGRSYSKSFPFVKRFNSLANQIEVTFMLARSSIFGEERSVFFLSFCSAAESVRTTQRDAGCLCDLCQLTWRCTTPTPAPLFFSSHFFCCLVSSAHAGSERLCVCRLAVFIHVHQPRRRSEPVPKSLRRISCPSLRRHSLRLPRSSTLTGRRLWNSRLTGLPEV